MIQGGTGFKRRELIRVYDLSLLSAKGDLGSGARKSFSKKHLVEARRLVRFRPMVPSAGQLLDISCGTDQRASGGSDSRVLWNAPYRRSSHSLGDIRIATHFSLFVYALPARPLVFGLVARPWTVAAAILFIVLAAFTGLEAFGNYLGAFM